MTKFLFDVSFDPEAEASDPAETQPVEATYGEADLAAARRQAFLEGEAAGEAAAQAGIDRAAADALTSLTQGVAQLLRLQAEASTAHQRAALQAAIAVLRKLQPELSRRQALVEVEGVLTQALELAKQEPRLVVRLSDGLLDPLRARIDDMTRLAGYEGRIVLIADDAVAFGDCRVEWADGGVERDTARLWREVETAITRIFAAPTTDPLPVPTAAAA